jgi:ABC-type multidrug transport system permease subunit
VWLSEMLRYIVEALASAMSSGVLVLNLFGVFIFFLFVFGIVPLCLLGMWFMNPLAIKKLFMTFGLTEKSLDEEKENEDKNGDTKTEQI